jgi:hypothetical protein
MVLESDGYGVTVYACIIEVREKESGRQTTGERTARHQGAQPLLHCCFTVVTLLVHCCCTVLTLLSHCCNIVVTLLLHCYDTVVTLLLHCCLTVVTGGGRFAGQFREPLYSLTP